MYDKCCVGLQKVFRMISHYTTTECIIYHIVTCEYFISFIASLRTYEPCREKKGIRTFHRVNLSVRMSGALTMALVLCLKVSIGLPLT